ncbi:hypothetical protein Tco_1482492 [Tanacetum coccineum]
MRIDPTMTQKEETYQVVLDIKNTTFYKAFLASADVPKIYMQQLWFTVTKIKNTNYYEFKLANKECQFDVEVFRKALYICPRVQGKDFIVPPSEEELLTFLIPWRTLASIINKCLSGKTTSNDRLRRPRVAIIWVMFYKKYVDFAKLIWEDFSYQIDNRISEDFQEYGRAIPNTMLTDEIKQSETYQMFIKYSSGLIPSKKSRGKGSQGKKSDVTPKPASVEVSDESNLEPTRRQTSSGRMSKKKVSIFTDDNIILEPDVALSQPHAEGLSEGTSMSPRVPDESTVILTTLSEGTGTKPRAPDEVQGNFEAKADITLDWGLEEDNEYSEKENVDEEIYWVYSDEEEEKKDDVDDEKSIDLEETDNEETEDEFVHSDEYVNDDVDEEIKDAEVAETRKGDEEITDTVKADVE